MRFLPSPRSEPRGGAAGHSVLAAARGGCRARACAEIDARRRADAVVDDRNPDAAVRSLVHAGLEQALVAATKSCCSALISASETMSPVRTAVSIGTVKASTSTLTRTPERPSRWAIARRNPRRAPPGRHAGQSRCRPWRCGRFGRSESADDRRCPDRAARARRRPCARRRAARDRHRARLRPAPEPDALRAPETCRGRARCARVATQPCASCRGPLRRSRPLRRRPGRRRPESARRTRRSCGRRRASAPMPRQCRPADVEAECGHA